MSETPRIPELKEHVYYLDHNNESLEVSKGTVWIFDGASILIKGDVDKGYSRTSREHKTSVFTAEDVAVAADDLLPAPAEGKERLLSDAIETILSDPEKHEELAKRLGEMSISRGFGYSPSMEDLGFKTVDELVGSKDNYGSNMWKVEDIITMSKQYREVTNTLAFAHGEKVEFERLTKEEAAAAQASLDDINRKALDTIYDHYAVSYENATVYESSTPGGKTLRVTVYPSVSAPIYFVEKIVVGEEAVPDIVDVVTKNPDYSNKPGYFKIAGPQ
jgi:hypothetical protein